MNLSEIKNKLFNQINLTSEETSHIFNLIMNGKLSEIDTTSILKRTRRMIGTREL